MKKCAIYAGSFDPFTQGHKSVVDKGLKEFEKVVILIAYNPQKQGFFSLDQKQEIVKSYFSNNNKVEVRVLSEEFVSSYAQRKGIEYLIRGVRNQHDKEYEENIEKVNKEINPKIKTKYFQAQSKYSHISSSLVKSLVGFPSWQPVVQSMTNEKVVSLFLNILTKEKLEKKWDKISKNKKWFDTIMKSHTESHRYYHNVYHLLELFSQLKKLKKEEKLQKEEIKALSYCIFFHDLIYNPKSKTNEEDSATLWLKFCQEENISKNIKNKVYKTILETKSHGNKTKGVLDYFIDLDLSILAAPEDKFFYYEKSIRQEYSFVPENIYKKERAKIMKSLISPYRTAWGKRTFEKKCIENLKRYKG